MGNDETSQHVPAGSSSSDAKITTFSYCKICKWQRWMFSKVKTEAYCLLDLHGSSRQSVNMMYIIC